MAYIYFLVHSVTHLFTEQMYIEQLLWASAGMRI